MNSYAKVRAPNSNKSKSNSDKPQPKKTEISVNIKQPFKISRPGIEQPKLRVNNAPSVVHIIERKASRMDQSKFSSQSERIRVIEPSSAKKAWRFNLTDDIQDQHPQPNIKEEKSNQKLMNVFPQEKIQVPNVNLAQRQESLSDPTARMAYQRRLQRAVSQSVSQNSKKSSRSVIQDSSVHQLDFGQPNKIQSIDIQQVVEIYRNADKKTLQRNLAVNDKWAPQKQARLKSSLMFDESNRIQVYQINEQSHMVSDKIKLKRKIQLVNEGSLYHEPEQIILEQLRDSRSSQRKSMMVIQDNEGKVRQIFIPDQFQEGRKGSMVKNQIRRMWIVEDKEKINQIINQKQGIFIGQDYQQSNSKIEMSSHKRIMSYSQVFNEEKQIKVQNSPIQRPLSQSVHLKSIQEEFYDNKSSLKQLRKLVIIEDNAGNHQIFIPEQFQQSRSEVLPINLKRSVNPIHFPSKSQMKVSDIPKPLQESVHLQSVQEGFYDDKRSSKLQRKLLILDNKDGRQQILVPEQIQVYDRDRSFINQRRAISSSQVIEKRQMRVSNPVPPFSQRIDLQSLHQDFEKQKRPSSKLQRKLLILEDKDGRQEIFVPEQSQNYDRERNFINQHRSISSSQIFEQKQMRVSNPAPPFSQRIDLQSLHQDYENQKRLSSKLQRRLVNLEQNNEIQLILVPDQSQRFSQQKILANHRRMISSSQAFEKKAQRVSYALPVPQDINIQSLNENWEDDRRSSKYLRKIILVQDNRGKPQDIFLPEQMMQQSRHSSASINHIRNMSHSVQRKVSSKLPQEQNIDLYSIQEGLGGSKRSAKNIRNLLIKQENVGEQQIFLNDQVQRNPQETNVVNHRRTLVNSERFNHKQDKIASRPMQFLPNEQKIDVSQVFEQVDPKQRGSRLSRKLLILQEKNGKIMSQQINIPSQLESSQMEKSIQGHRRTIIHAQEMNGSRRLLQKAQNVPIQPSYQSLQINPIEEMWGSNRKTSRLPRNLLVQQGKVSKVMAQQINIPEQLEYSHKDKSFLSYKRTVNPSQEANSHIKQQCQSVQIHSLEQMWGSDNKNSRLSRKLLVLQSKNGQLLAQQIAIPEQLQQSHSKNDVNSHKRELRLMKLPQQPKAESKKSSNIDIEPQNFEFSSHNDSKLRMSRNLLLIKEDSGRQIYQQVIIPQDFEVKQAKISNIHYKRQIINQPEPQMQKQQKIRGSLPPSNEIKYEQVIIHSDLQQKSSQRFVQSHRRTVKHLQALPQPIYQSINEKLSKNIIEEPLLHEPVQIQQIFEDYSSKSKKSKQARNLLVVQQPNGQVLSQQIIIPEQFSQSKQQKQPKLEHKRQFTIISFEDDAPINEQNPILNEMVPIDDIVINSVEEDYKQSRKSQKTSRNLLAIQNSNGETLYQEIFLPDMEESNPGQNAVDSHKRQFKIITVEDNFQKDQPYPQQKQEEKPMKINIHPLPQTQQIHVEEIHQGNNRNDGRINPKFKRALLLARNQQGEVISQQIQIPDQHFQMDSNQKPSINYQRNIRLQDTIPPIVPSFPQENINIPEQTYMNNVEKGPMSYKRQIKSSQLKTGKGVPSNSAQISQELHDEGSRNRIFPEKSFNPSTLNSSQAQNINFTTSLEQSRISPEYRPLVRSLAPCPEKLSQSEHSNDPHERFFDVYNPRAFRDGRLSSSQLSLPSPIHNVDRPLKPHRRPGFN